MPADFRLRGAKLSPSSITVPPFVAVSLTIASQNDDPAVVIIHTKPAKSVTVPGHSRGTLKVAGLRPGAYKLTVDGRTVGTVVSGGEVGP